MNWLSFWFNPFLISLDLRPQLTRTLKKVTEKAEVPVIHKVVS